MITANHSSRLRVAPGSSPACPGRRRECPPGSAASCPRVSAGDSERSCTASHSPALAWTPVQGTVTWLQHQQTAQSMLAAFQGLQLASDICTGWSTRCGSGTAAGVQMCACKAPAYSCTALQSPAHGCTGCEPSAVQERGCFATGAQLHGRLLVRMHGSKPMQCSMALSCRLFLITCPDSWASKPCPASIPSSPLS